MTGPTALGFAEAAIVVLERADRPLHVSEITRDALAAGLLQSQGKTPEATMGAILAVKAKEPGSRFVRTKPATFGLREWLDRSQNPATLLEAPPEGRVRIPHYPTYDQVRGAIRAWVGLRRSQVTGMRSVISEQTGTVEKNIDWTNPDEWIPERLSGEAREVARTTWEKSGKTVNPRHSVGVWLLVTNYGLLSEIDGGTLGVTNAGRDFLEQAAGKTVRLVDDTEGLLWLLGTLIEKGRAVRGDLLPQWREFLAEHSKIRSEDATKGYLWARLRNLGQRGYVKQSGKTYEPTDSGATYLSEQPLESPDDLALHGLIRQRRESVREQLRGLLVAMDPIAFEHVVKNLLEAMGYEDVQVTAPSGDQGVDVIARIEAGITSVVEVVQVKRHTKNIQRSVLDALRGSLHRFQAVRGTIITVGDFAKGTTKAAFENGVAPITLINGEKIIDLLIQHGIGVKKRTIEVWEIDVDAFAPESDDGEPSTT
jgi:restriction system protein